ncbi:phosphatase PAP2 family protein [Leucobacter chromiireducens]|uniref:phosphatase PAP2 family protein n=1 Tax=Leucobacter chromiireducens TaxID=283877 RepID=UPI000F637429|nr:phosphatase PAP2 family protein [Leucobacter chromiireducens]
MDHRSPDSGQRRQRATATDARLRASAPWAWVGVALVIGASCFFRFTTGGPFGIDVWWHGVAGVSRGSLPYAVAVFFAEIGGGLGGAACAAIAVALLLALRRGRDAGALATAMLGGVLLSEALKSFALRPRPWDQLYPVHGSSFPSGHSLGAAALAVSLAFVVLATPGVSRRLRQLTIVLACAWPLLMMWSRTALHAHWLTDVLAGGLLGACVALLARWLWFRGVAAGPGRPSRTSR